MQRRVYVLGLLLILCGTFLLSTAAYAIFEKGGMNQLLSADQAFVFDFEQKENKLIVNWQIQPGYYLYQKQIKFLPSHAKLGKYQLPKGKYHEDEFFGKTVVYFNNLVINIPIIRATDQANIEVKYQGCAAAGYCYPPETKIIPLSSVIATKKSLATNKFVQLNANSSAKKATSGKTEQPFSPLWALLFGIGVVFTPCVLPMYPLISGIILGKQRPKSLIKIFWLAFSYVQGMALTYTLLGLIVAAAGLSFQAALQHPYVLIIISILFILLAFSMFGFYNLQLTSSLQTKLINWSDHQKAGSYFGVFIMGALAGLICSPCTTAPLSAILLYIAQSGDLLIGGLTLYLYALGMGLPLIGIILFGHRLLPRSGPWMQYVKEAFGFVILALPIFLLERIFGEIWSLRLSSLLITAFCLWVFILLLKKHNSRARIGQILFLLLAIIAAQPLQNGIWQISAISRPQSHMDLKFKQVKNWQEIKQAINNNTSKIVMLDFYADWCVACKEFEKYTFSDPKVKSKLDNMLLLQANVTENNAEQKSLLQYLDVYGLPTIIFYDDKGIELPNSRVYGFMNSKMFYQHLEQITQRQGK
ncbi:protein-disulfide reductase DsbD [Candidatus Arsenophonus triatominarum]|uniref:protein-disulfide reductase DsbD n=1 Tax=Candidatus Arsenophonus triatominarum TaxID=57911 RepID=UPI0007C4CCDD|nr:protein-disulfide reductase DsbD [Candidatus Arsenophonus triatominarum]